MLKFGVPLGIQGFAHMASRYWDNLAISHYFGTGALGAYNMAYNLADIPAIQVGEQIALVLMPSMAELPPRATARARSSDRRRCSRSIIFPLAVGLGLVAYPLIALDPAGERVAGRRAAARRARVPLGVPADHVGAVGVPGSRVEDEPPHVARDREARAPLVRGIARSTASASRRGRGRRRRVRSDRDRRRRDRRARGPVAAASCSRFLQPLAACGVMAAAVYGVHAGTLLAIGLGPSRGVARRDDRGGGAASYVVAALIICRDTALLAGSRQAGDEPRLARRD